ncbi:MAG TPA: alpha/beta hydrolase [Galbitalea sp.]|jgi:pimeloyl-ACP methyl ester carboxylesterase
MNDHVDDFDSVHDMADEFGLPDAILQPAVRVDVGLPDHRTLSAIKWGTESPEIVFIHGSGQNAHTWDLVVSLLGRPALAVDLPGHGHSSWRDDRNYTAPANAEAVALAVERLAPHANLVVGMSLGGLTAISLATGRPGLVRRLLLVDVLPRSVPRADTTAAGIRGAAALIDGPRVFRSLEEMVATAIAASPSRLPATTRRGVINNAQELPDGSWRWRYDDLRTDRGFDPVLAEQLWSDLAGLTIPLALARGSRSGFVEDTDLHRFRSAHPHAPVLTIEGSGHSVQGDKPAVLAATIAWCARLQ